MTGQRNHRSIAALGWAVLALVAGVASAWLSAKRPLTAPVQAAASETEREAVRDRPSAAPTPDPPFEARARRLGVAALADLPGMFEEFRRLTDGEREEALEWLFARWVQLDAEDGWRFAQTRLGVKDRDLYLIAWALIDAETAGAHATNDNCELAAICHELRVRDARRAARFIAAIPVRKMRWVSSRTEDDLAELFAVDPEATIRAAAKFRGDLDWSTVVEPLLKSDPSLAWEMLRSISLRTERIAAWRSLAFHREADAEPLLKLVEAEREIPAAQREEMLATLLHRRAQEVCGDDPLRQREWLLGEFSQRGMRAQPSNWLSRQAAVRAMRDASPEALAAALAQLEGREAAEFTTFSYLEDVAIEAARKRDGSDLGDPFASKADHPVAALEMLAQQPPGRARDLALAMLLTKAPIDMMAEWRSQLADREARAVLDVELLENGSLSDVVDSRVLGTVGADFDEALAAWVVRDEKMLAEGRRSFSLEYRSEAFADALVKQPAESMDDGSVETIVNGFALMEPDAGRHLVERLPESRRPAAAAGLMRQWATTDPAAASEWLVSQQGAVREAGAAALSCALAGNEPDAAFAWGESLTALGMRADVLAEVVSTWAARDAEGARERIEASSLPAEEKEALLHRITPP